MKFALHDKVRVKSPSCPDSPFNGAEGFVQMREAGGVWVFVPSLGEHFTTDANLTRIDAVHNVPASSGGCWYCETVDDKLDFSREFDTYVHTDCIRKALRDDTSDQEAMIFAEEFGLFDGGEGGDEQR